MLTIDTTNMCSHLQAKQFEPTGEYHHIWEAMQVDEGLTAVVRSRQLHIYRNNKKILIHRRLKNHMLFYMLQVNLEMLPYQYHLLLHLALYNLMQLRILPL